jgi:hypothetical protein
MGESVIAVPIHLDALYVKEQSTVAPAMADFTRLPYFDGDRDINSQRPWLGETAASEPFGSTNTVLKKGIHLHWRFPTGLTTGIQSGDGKIAFPNLPDRWLIIRGRDTGGNQVVEEKWMIESNYMHPEGTTKEGAAYPIEPKDKDAIAQPYRYVGQTLPWDQWLQVSRTSGEYRGSPLTAVGYGEPTYASFYPNCSRQFGFHDPQYAGQIPSDLYYQVIGWYSNPNNDWIQFLLQHPFDQISGENWRTRLSRILKERLKWSVAGNPTVDVVIACHGSLIFRPQPNLEWAVRLEKPAVAFGATMTEALSAYLASEIAPDDPAKKAMIEDKLEAIMLDRKLSTRAVDLTAKFKEARHEKGFDEVYAGILWMVRAEASPGEQRNPNAGAASWPDVAEKLDELNRLQSAYQLIWERIRSLRARLYSDWCRYMRLTRDAANNPKILEPRYKRLSPSPADTPYYGMAAYARGLIELYWREIDRLVADVGTLNLSLSNADTPPSYSETKPNSLARKISEAVDSVLQILRTHQRESVGKIHYEIQPAVAPRYWSPTEPVILLTGEAARIGEPFHVEDIDIGAHTGVTASDGGPGGTLAAGTYQYNVTAVDGAGRQTLIAASNQQTIIANHHINLTWGAVADATAYNVYRYVSATSGHFMASVPTNAFTDNGSITPASALTTIESLLACELFKFADIERRLRINPSDFIKQFPFKPREWKEQPWHPLFLQWEVELTPFLRLANLTTPDGNYDESFITRNFTLKRSDADLSSRTVAGEMDNGQVYQPAPGTFVYRGSSLLTPHALDQYLAGFRRFLDRLEDQQPQARDRASGGESLPFPNPISTGDDYSSPSYIEDLIRQLKREPSSGLDLETIGKLGEVLKRFEKDNFFCLAQRLSGFNQALLGQRQMLRIPIRDPIGFTEDWWLAGKVEGALDGEAYPAPEPGKAFCPIRAGELRVKRFRLVSTFGRQLDFQGDTVVTATPMQSKSRAGASIFLAPRLVQPARLQFRWLAAEVDQQEMNAHPDSTPICGWVIANHLDDNLFVYSGDGQVLGYMEVEGDQRVRWRTAPGAKEPVVRVDQIGNSSLRRMVAFFLSGSADYFNQFLDDLEAAQARIEPEKTGDPLPMGRPLALVRAKLNLELQGLPAIQHNSLDPGLSNAIPGAEDNRFTAVRFPIRLGEQDQLNDGLAVYWAENEDGSYKDNAYVIPNYDEAASQQQKKCDFLYQSIQDAPLNVTMLVDPRGVVHAATGILPSKAIEIPPHQYASAMLGFEVTFLQAPVLAGSSTAEEETIALPVTDPPGYFWSWIERHSDDWISSDIQTADLFRPFSGATEIREGWLKLALIHPGLDVSPVYGWTQDRGTGLRVSSGNTLLQGRLVCANAQDMIRQNHWVDPRYPRPGVFPDRVVAKLPAGYEPLAGQDKRYAGRARWLSGYPELKTLWRSDLVVSRLRDGGNLEIGVEGLSGEVYDAVARIEVILDGVSYRSEKSLSGVS